MKLFIILAMTILGSAFAKPKAVIFCHTPRFFKSFVVSNDKVVFLKKESDNSNREIASIPAVRSKKLLKGFVKELAFEGDKYTINVEDKTEFSEVNDYLAIRSQKGHEITYSLSCQNI